MKQYKLLAILSVVAIMGCSKQGATGPAGANGTNGNANVTANTYTVAPGDWSKAGTGIYTVNIGDGSISNVNADDVELAVSTTQNVYIAMPSADILISGDFMSYIYTNNSISIAYFYTSPPTITLEFKVIITPAQ